MEKPTLQNKMTRGEQIFGWIWMFAQQLVVPVIVVLPVLLLQLPVSELGINCIVFALNFLVTVLCFRKFLMKSLRQLCKHFRRFAGFSLLGILLFFLCNFACGLVVEFLLPNYANANDTYIASMIGDHYWLMFFCTVVLVPIAEEVIYRGLVFGTAYRRSRVLGYLLSAAIFSAIHVVGYILSDPPLFLLVSFLQYLPSGLVLAWVYARTDCIFAPVLIHAINNMIGMLFMR